jgi:hypothetical protein
VMEKWPWFTIGRTALALAWLVGNERLVLAGRDEVEEGRRVL